MVTKTHILQEIKRTAKANGGKPLGTARFEAETGIRRSDWDGKYWARWGDTLVEAGYRPNQLQGAYNRDELLDVYSQLVQELGRLSTSGDLRLKARNDQTFPSHNVFGRFGSKSQLVQHVIEYCQDHKEYESVICLCEEHAPRNQLCAAKSRASHQEEDGFVYLIKSGRFYKIGKSNAAGRREYELAIQLPEKAKTIHVIRTDDASGIEAYWHKRFKEKRKNGEWFELDAADIAGIQTAKVHVTHPSFQSLIPNP